MGYCLKVEDPYLQGFCQSQSFKVMLFFNEDEIWISFWSLYLEIVRIMYIHPKDLGCLLSDRGKGFWNFCICDESPLTP